MSDYWKDNNIKKPQQVVVCAANKFEDIIICGARHWDHIMNDQFDLMKKADPTLSGPKFEQGFIDQFGAFLTREEAMNIVKENGQPFDIDRNGGDGVLFSEGLY